MVVAYGCLGPTAVEAELKKSVEDAGGSVFKLVIDDTSILLSFELEPGNSMSRKANYVPFAPGCIAGAFDDMRAWINRVAGMR